MLKKVRQKVATSVSKIEYSDYYEFSKWLRVPLLTQIDFGQLEPEPVRSAKDTHVDVFESPITYKSNFLISLPKLLSVREKLVVKRPKAVLVFFTIAKPQNVSYNNYLLHPDEHSHKKNFLIEIVTRIVPYEFSFSGINQKEVNFEFAFSEVMNIDMFIQPPIVEDKLAEIVPEVYEVELLNENALISDKIFDLSHHILDVSNLPVPEVKRYMIPGIDDLATHVINYKPERIHPSAVSEIKFAKDIRISISKSPKLDFKKTTTKVLRFSQTSSTLTEVFNPLEDDKSTIVERKLIKHIITGSVKATWEKTKKVIPDLLPHQEEGAKFLADNNFTVFAEEPGSDKIIQAVGALKFLFNTSQIKSTLIITKKTRLGNSERVKRLKFQDSLISKLLDYAPEINFKVLSFTNKDKEENLSNPIIIIAYEQSDELNELLELASLNRNYDLVIIDEFTDTFNSNREIENLFRRFYPDHFWLLTGNINQDDYKKNFKENYLPEGQNWKFLIRPIEKLTDKVSPVKYENIWFEPDEEQIEEYNNLIEASRDDLKRVIESLNPFKFQSVVFSLIHRIKQIGNFSSAKLESPKSKYLIDQLKISSSNKRKTLLFTQYDNHGLKRLEKIFDNNNLRYLSVQSGSSPEDLRRALNLFYTRDDYRLFMTNLKPARIKMNLKMISYIINFDQWWNPSSQWQMEEDLGLENYRGQQIVYTNYLMSDYFDEIIYDLLESKSIINKQIFGELSNESLAELVTEYDWQNVFDLSMDIPGNYENLDFVKTSLSKYNIDDFIELMKRLFMRLGYRDILVTEMQDEPSFYISGRSGKLRSNTEFRAKCFLAKNVNASEWEDVYVGNSVNPGSQRLFVIATGAIAKSQSTLNQKVNLIFGDQLVDLINQLNLISRDTIKLRSFDEEE